MLVSSELANPLFPKVVAEDPTVATTAFDNVDVNVPESIEEPAKFTAVPDVKTDEVIPDSNASAQPSPSESKSK